jgi:hypothetical protein
LNKTKWIAIIVVLLIIIIVVFVLYYIAFTGSNAAKMNVDRNICIDNQYFIIYQLYKFKKETKHFPVILNELAESGMQSQLLLCPSINKPYIYKQVEDGSHFELSCDFDKNEFYNHIVHPDLSSDDVLSDERLDKAHYNLFFNELCKCKDVSHIRIHPEHVFIVVKDVEHYDFSEMNVHLENLRKILKSKGVSKKIGIRGVLK